MASRPLIVAEAAGPDGGPPHGGLWRALADLAGVDDPRSLGDLVTLLGYDPGQNKPTVALLRSAWDALPKRQGRGGYRRIVLLGRRVAKAAGFPTGLGYCKWSGRGGTSMALVSPPAPANRRYNDPDALAEARAFLRALAVGDAGEPPPPDPAPADSFAPVGRAGLSPAPGETGAAWEACRIYLELGPRRTIRAAAIAAQRSRLSTVKEWASRWGWAERARQYDGADLAAAMRERAHRTEIARQAIYDGALEAATLLNAVVSGDYDPGPLRDDDKPYLSPATRVTAARDVLAMAGIVPAKRREIIHRVESGVDEASRAFEELSIDQLRRLVAGDPPDDAPTKH